MKPRRSYRVVIRCYPPDYRTRYGEELIDTALELTDEGLVTADNVDQFTAEWDG